MLPVVSMALIFGHLGRRLPTWLLDLITMVTHGTSVIWDSTQYMILDDQLYTANHATNPIQIRKITVQICGDFWVTQ